MIILKDTLFPNSFNCACFWKMLFSKRTECQFAGKLRELLVYRILNGTVYLGGKSWLCPLKEVSNHVELSLYTTSLWASQLVS